MNNLAWLYFVGLPFGNDLQPAIFDYAVLESANGSQKVNEGTSMVSKSWHSLNVRQQQVQRIVKMQELV